MLSLGTHGGSEVDEVSATADEVNPGDFQSVCTAFNKRGDRLAAGPTVEEPPSLSAILADILPFGWQVHSL